MSRIVVRCDKCGIIGLCNDTDQLIHKVNNCNGNLEKTNILEKDFDLLCDISSDKSFLQAMIDLKEKDPIEYQLKISQFKAQLQQQKSSASQTGSMVRCPRCGSANITAGQRGYSLLTGFVGSGSTVNRCANCGHKWKP
jgi:DNA-directed RNA polymerase subunit M/transcription elongation factor TFIIS